MQPAMLHYVAGQRMLAFCIPLFQGRIEDEETGSIARRDVRYHWR